MSTASIAPEVAQFAAAVRSQLADLSDDEREELAGGLEADLSDLVDERGTEALGDPVAYAHELRSAAGLAAEMGERRLRRPLLELIDERLDVARERFDATFAGLPGGPWELLMSLRPVWWVLRAYVAVQALDLLSGNAATMALVPTLSGFEIPLLVVAAVGSVQIGRGRLWPGSPSGVVPRVCLLGLNGLTIALAPAVFSALPTGVSREVVDQAQYYGYQYPATGIIGNGTDVTNIQPYDAEGTPLTGVQLFDQNGEPLAVNPDVSEDYVEWAYPWSNVNGEVWNAFPMPEGEGSRSDGFRRASPWTSDTPPTFPRPPLDQVPSVTIPDAAYGEAGPPAPEAEVAKTPERPAGDKSGRKPRR